MVCRYCVEKSSGCKVIKQCSSTVDAVCITEVLRSMSLCISVSVSVMVCKVGGYVSYILYF